MKTSGFFTAVGMFLAIWKVTVCLPPTITFPPGGNGTLYIPENTPLGAEIANLTTDSGGIFLAQDIPDVPQFQIELNGKVKVALTATLDIETQAVILLHFKAVRLGEQSYGTLYIVLTDINDNNPIFPEPSYPFLVIHGSGAGTYIGVVNATDADVDKEQSTIISYDFINETNVGGTFTVNKTGHIEVAEGRAVLANERRAYRLLLVATDSGDPPLQGTATVLVAICAELSSAADSYTRSHGNAVVVVTGLLLFLHRQVFEGL